MAQKDITIQPGNRVVVDANKTDLYYQQPLPIYNFTSINISEGATPTSGTLLISSYIDYGIDIFNRQFGEVGTYDLTTSGFTKISSIFGLDLLRTNIPISGAKFARY